MLLTSMLNPGPMRAFVLSTRSQVIPKGIHALDLSPSARAPVASNLRQIHSEVRSQSWHTSAICRPRTMHQQQEMDVLRCILVKRHAATHVAASWADAGRCGQYQSKAIAIHKRPACQAKLLCMQQLEALTPHRSWGCDEAERPVLNWHDTAG